MNAHPFENSIHRTSRLFSNKPSTQAVATMRAIHQLIDTPIIFSDNMALPILGLSESELATELKKHSDFLSRAIRISVAIRSRYAEDQRQLAKAQHINQLVILGAGLDTYAYRNLSSGETIFEVDLNDIQTAKLQQINQLGIQAATHVSYVSCNFETDDLQHQLILAGFDKSQPAFFSLLGVTPYLTKQATENIFAFVARCATGSQLVFDYLSEPATLGLPERVGLEMTCACLAEGGEPVKSFYNPLALIEQCKQLGFSAQLDILPEHLNQLYLTDRSDDIQASRVLRLFKAVV